jgi:hypothetical protein
LGGEGVPSRRSIFLSYRRQETRHLAGRLADQLFRQFGEGYVFMDVDSIEPGRDFGEAIERAVNECAVLLALIGPTWASVVDAHGRRRLDDPDDLVVLELRAALARAIPVIPVLVDGARAPTRDDLPPTLGALARRHAVRVDHDTFRADCAALLQHVARIVADARTEVSDLTGPSVDTGGVGARTGADSSLRDEAREETPREQARREHAWPEQQASAASSSQFFQTGQGLEQSAAGWRRHLTLRRMFVTVVAASIIAGAVFVTVLTGTGTGNQQGPGLAVPATTDAIPATTEEPALPTFTPPAGGEAPRPNIAAAPATTRAAPATTGKPDPPPTSTPSASDEATMPNIVGLTEAQAKDDLTQVGFRRISIRRESVSDDAGDGRVLEQSIEPGRQVSTDEQITLTVGEAPGGLVS